MEFRAELAQIRLAVALLVPRLRHRDCADVCRVIGAGGNGDSASTTSSIVPTALDRLAGTAQPNPRRCQPSAAEDGWWPLSRSEPGCHRELSAARAASVRGKSAT